jgi:hypothetical protein
MLLLLVAVLFFCSGRNIDVPPLRGDVESQVEK